jgi:hypothetical protein
LEERRRSVDAEVDRLRSIGATLLWPGSVERGEYWVVMRDPERNGFCVQQGWATTREVADVPQPLMRRMTVGSDPSRDPYIVVW